MIAEVFRTLSGVLIAVGWLALVAMMAYKLPPGPVFLFVALCACGSYWFAGLWWEASREK